MFDFINSIHIHVKSWKIHSIEAAIFVWCIDATKKSALLNWNILEKNANENCRIHNCVRTNEWFEIFFWCFHSSAWCFILAIRLFFFASFMFVIFLFHYTHFALVWWKWHTYKLQTQPKHQLAAHMWMYLLSIYTEIIVPCKIYVSIIIVIITGCLNENITSQYKIYKFLVWRATKQANKKYNPNSKFTKKN